MTSLPLALRKPQACEAGLAMTFSTQSTSLLVHVKDFIFLPKRIVGDSSKKTPDPRIVFIKKSQLDLGVHLCGGNLHGVFVAEVEDDSPAKGPDGLVPGDLILEVRSSTVCAACVVSLCPFTRHRMRNSPSPGTLSFVL